MKSSAVRPLTGLALVVVIGLIIALAIALFRGDFTKTIPVTVISDRAGLVMNPDAKVKMRGITVGKVASIESLSDGQAAIHLDMDPAQLHFVPSNVGADITSSTVFGAKFVELVEPDRPSQETMRAGQVIQGDYVTVEINTVFQQLVSILRQINPVKLNTTLGELANALDGRGEEIGRTLSDFNAFLARFQSSLPAMRRDLRALPVVARAYADSASDLVTTADASSRISQTIVDTQSDLDAVLLGTVGFADIGSQVLGDNRRSLTDLLRVLVPTTDLLNQYHPTLDCSLKALVPFTKSPVLPEPGILVSIGFGWGLERYRYPGDLPKVAARGGPNCDKVGLPILQPNEVPPFMVTDIGGNRWKYGNDGIVLNSDGLKQILFGPIDGPPRNSQQIGMPG